MKRWKHSLIRLLMAAALAMGAAGAALAQDGAEDEEALRALQDQQFEAMFNDPSNLDLMFAYALTSIKLKDYEAAISTLDRMLIFNPNMPRVRLELAGSYFRIGSYPIARHYFAQVIENESTPPDVRARAEKFVAEIDNRVQPSTFRGVVSLATIFTTNANSAPDSRDLLINGINEAFFLDEEDTAQTDVGVAFGAVLSHSYDLGGTNNDAWLSDLALYAQRFESTPTGGADVGVFRSGPRLSLNDERYGPKARPYVELDHVRSDDDGLYYTAGVGVEYSDTLDKTTTTNADIRFGWRDYQSNGGSSKDGLNIRARGGFTYFVDSANTARMRGLFEYKGSDDRGERSVEGGVEATIAHRYESGFDFATRPWSISATARGVYRVYDEPGVADNRRERQDVDLRVVVNNTAYVADNMALTLKAEYAMRDSNIKNFDVDGFTLTAGVQLAF